MDPIQTHDARRTAATPTGKRPAPRRREHYGWWRGVQVTDSTLCVGDRTFWISDLRRLQERTGRPQSVRRAVLAVTTGQAAVVALAVAGLVQAGGWTPVLAVVVAVQALATTALVGLALIRWRAPAELWAVHQGELTLLYRDADRYEFGKVRRAVERAMVSHRLLK